MNRGRVGFRGTVCALFLLAVSLQAWAAARHTPASLAEQAATVSGDVHLHGLRRRDAGDTWLNLAPQPIFAPKAVLEVVGNDGSRKLTLPAVRHFHGHERDDPAALAFVSVHPDGRVRGWLRRGGQIEAFERAPGAQAQVVTLARVDLATGAGERRFSCGSEQLPAFASLLPKGDVGRPASAPVSGAATPVRRGSDPEHWVSVAIDSDFEYYDQFDDADDAASYAADLIGFSSLLYRDEIDTGLLISYLRLFETAEDPWEQTGTSCILYEFGRHWGQNQKQVERTIAHFLSGKNLNGGIAWLGALCASNETYNIGSQCPGLPAVGSYKGGYGVSTSVRGTFDPGSPQSVWDIVVVSHEIGHNFNSPHTHCYAGIGGNPAHVDHCFGAGTPGCHAGASSLPGPAGQGAGTLMSYCHLLGGGLSNISLNFGTGHPYGVQPIRVPNRMHAHVQERAELMPGCFVNPELIFADGFE